MPLDGDTRTEEQQRQDVVNCAKMWVGTPYVTGGRVMGPGGGADCLTSTAGTYEMARMIPPVEIEYYPFDWHLHRKGERYLEGVLKYARELPEGSIPGPGDLVLFQFGYNFSHGAIVVQWPRIIHAYVGRNCTFENVDQAKWLKYVGENSEHKGKLRKMKIFTLW